MKVTNGQGGPKKTGGRRRGKRTEGCKIGPSVWDVFEGLKTKNGDRRGYLRNLTLRVRVGLVAVSEEWFTAPTIATHEVDTPLDTLHKGIDLHVEEINEDLGSRREEVQDFVSRHEHEHFSFSCSVPVLSKHPHNLVCRVEKHAKSI